MILLWASCLWAIAATVVALLPMKRQFIPGVILLALAPVLIVWTSVAVAWWAGVLALAAFVSMFRNPLRYFLAKARGQNPTLPPDLNR